MGFLQQKQRASQRRKKKSPTVDLNLLVDVKLTRDNLA